MIIHFVQSGGFANIMREKTINTENEKEEVIHKIQELIKKSDFFNLPEYYDLPQFESADLKQYDLKVVDGDREHEVTFFEQHVPFELAEIFDCLQQWKKEEIIHL